MSNHKGVSCDCGAEIAKTTHADYCSTVQPQELEVFERECTCVGEDESCICAVLGSMAPCGFCTRELCPVCLEMYE